MWCVFLALLLLTAARGVRPALRRDLIRHGRPVCLSCGYDLVGAAGERCPECGDDITNLSVRAWEPIGAMAMYPELAACRSRAEAHRCLNLARARAGLIATSPRLILLALLVLNLILWIGVSRAADAIAFHLRRDLPPRASSAILIAAIASFFIVTVGWYWLLVASVRASIRACLRTELNPRVAPPIASDPTGSTSREPDS
jgi:hypothetical protein